MKERYGRKISVWRKTTKRYIPPTSDTMINIGGSTYNISDQIIV
jgi:hypothetical protein